MIKKLNLKLILLECLALIFIFSGLKRLFVGYNADLIQALIKEDFDKFETLTDISASQFILDQVYWNTFSLILSLLLIISINWRYKLGILNSVILFTVALGILYSGLLTSGVINSLFNSFCKLFGSELGLSYFIGGSILILIGLLMLWQTIKKKWVGKSTLHS